MEYENSLLNKKLAKTKALLNNITEPNNPKIKERYWTIHARESYRNRHLYNITEALRNYNASSISI